MLSESKTSGFADRILSRANATKSWLVVGLDPDVSRFPDGLLQKSVQQASGLSDLIFRFNQAVIEGAAPRTVAFKPQIAFYEQYGMEGIRALQQTIHWLRARGLPTILDGKRNDIGSTAGAYARAWLAPERRLGKQYTVPNEWQVDALTISPFLGRDGIRPFSDAAHQYGGGLFVLLRTSNPSGGELQNLRIGRTGRLVWEELAYLLEDEIRENRNPESGLSSFGFVVGATLPADEIAAIRSALPKCLFLMPGIGAQGGDIRGLRRGRSGEHAAILPSASRSILYPEAGRGAWSDRFRDESSWLTVVRDSCEEQTATLAEELHPVLF